MIKELQTAFKDITYLDSTHSYFTRFGIELMSVTRFLSNLKDDFKKDFWATLKAYEYSGYDVKSTWGNFHSFHLHEEGLDYGATHRLVSIYDNHDHLTVTPDQVKAQWKLDSLIGTTRGTYIHNYLESLEARSLDIPKVELIDGMSTAQAVNYVNSLNVARKLCVDFVEYAQQNLILVAAEFCIGDPKIGLAGRFDRLYYNKLTNEYEIWDFKTDKQLRTKSGYGKLKLFNVPNCEFEKYSLQTSIYKKIVQDNTGIKLGTSKIVWFNLKDNQYSIIECKDYVELITETLNDEDNRRTYL